MAKKMKNYKQNIVIKKNEEKKEKERDAQLEYQRKVIREEYVLNN